MNEIKILWVDDEIDMLKPHILFLEKKNYKVTTANNGQDAIDLFRDENFDIVATLCDNARETCPVFTGVSKHQIHRGFEDPADTTGSDMEITKVYRRIRDEIREWVKELTRGNL